ncbi:hypothetical protein INR49_025098, partial [Caranx melampygus]
MSVSATCDSVIQERTLSSLLAIQLLEQQQNICSLLREVGVQLCVLLESCKDLLSQGALCPKLLWQEYRRYQRRPSLEVVYHLCVCSILPLKYILESDEGVRSWLVSQLKALCSWMPPQGEDETKQVQQKVLSSDISCVSVVVGVLVGCGFEQSIEPARRISLLCCSVLDEMLFWLLDTVDKSLILQPSGAAAELWIQIFDASLCGASASADALQRFFTHSLTQTLTYKPRLTVSDAITQQNKWTFAKASRPLTSLFRKLAVIFSVEQLLRHLQQVLETHEVNWKHVLCFLSTLLVYNSCAQSSLKELLSRLLSSAFESYDLENMITAFLLARQAALEGTSIFSSYSDWFKMSFGGGSSYHATSKKSLVFLLKFLSDLVPFEPPQYLKVHVLHPPYVPVKHRSLLMEYTSLAKTRLADLKESVEDMGLYEDVSAAGGAPVQSQAVQDVEKAVSLFESTGRISATVMEARADKIPAAQYSSYVESCQRQRQQEKNAVSLNTSDDPLEVLKVQLQAFTELVVDGDDGEMLAQLSRISHTLSVLFPGHRDELTEQTVIKLHIDPPPSPELHDKVINMILRNFCQCLLDTSRVNPPNKQSVWASRFVTVLLGNTQLLSSLIHRIWDLFHNQVSSLSAAHILGLAALVVHLHASMSHSHLVQLVPPVTPDQYLSERLWAQRWSAAHTLTCSPVSAWMEMRLKIFFVLSRLCVAAVSYGLCRGDSLPQHQRQDYIPSSFYKKLLYLIPRLVHETRRTPLTADGPVEENQEENLPGLWNSATDSNSTWRKTAWCLWRHTAFQQLQDIPQYQLSFSEWLVNELRVQRSEDALSDPERQEYQQWACLELYLSLPEDQGGCGGHMKSLCSHILSAIMDQQLSDQSLRKLDHRVSATGTCLPDILSRLQELIYEMEVTNVCGGWSSAADVCDFLFEFVSGRCSSAVSSASLSVSAQLSMQHTMKTWNRVLLALPAMLLVKVRAEGGRTTLDCNTLIQHVNQHQRMVCSPAGLLPCHVTAHFLKGVLCASRCCRCPRTEVNKALSQISLQCPLLLTSTMFSKWPLAIASASSSSLLLAASLHCAWRGHVGDNQGFSAALNMLRPDGRTQHQQVLVFWLFLSVNDYLSALLCPQEKSIQRTRSLCTDLLSVLVDSADWLLIFHPNEQGVYHSVTMVTSVEFTRLMPWAFYSLLHQQRDELLQRAACCPGFLHTAVLCYIRLLQLFLEGDTPTPTAKPPEEQVTEPQAEPSQILSYAKQLLLRIISQTSAAALSSSQLRQLESQCADLDPEVAAALSVSVLLLLLLAAASLSIHLSQWVDHGHVDIEVVGLLKTLPTYHTRELQ